MGYGVVVVTQFTGNAKTVLVGAEHRLRDLSPLLAEVPLRRAAVGVRGATLEAQPEVAAGERPVREADPRTAAGRLVATNASRSSTTRREASGRARSAPVCSAYQRDGPDHAANVRTTRRRGVDAQGSWYAPSVTARPSSATKRMSGRVVWAAMAYGPGGYAGRSPRTHGGTPSAASAAASRLVSTVETSPALPSSAGRSADEQPSTRPPISPASRSVGRVWFIRVEMSARFCMRAVRCAQYRGGGEGRQYVAPTVTRVVRSPWSTMMASCPLHVPAFAVMAAVERVCSDGVCRNEPSSRSTSSPGPAFSKRRDAGGRPRRRRTAQQPQTAPASAHRSARPRWGARRARRAPRWRSRASPVGTRWPSSR